MEARLDEHVAAYLLPMSGFLFLFFAALVPSHLLLMEGGPERDVVVAAALASTVLMGTLTLTLRRVRVPARWSHHLAFGVAMIPVANALLHLGTTGDLVHTTNVMLVILATGAFLLRPRWFLATEALIVVSWGTMALMLGGESGPWPHFAFGVGLSLLVAGVVFTMHFHSIIGLESLNLRLQDLARLDGLTGVANRRWFDVRLAEGWRSHAREKIPLSLVVLDLDHFKLLNDRRGHGAGDVALRQVAGVLRASARSEDDLPARLGGEEFAVLLPRTSGEQAMLVAERIREGVRRLDVPNPDAPGDILTVSLGVASATPGVGGLAQGLLDAADDALYHAKNAGRDRTSYAGDG
jgi:diguanylate cyclase (GGDEF)-like protein